MRSLLLLDGRIDGDLCQSVRKRTSFIEQDYIEVSQNGVASKTDGFVFLAQCAVLAMSIASMVTVKTAHSGLRDSHLMKKARYLTQEQVKIEISRSQHS